MVSLDRLTKKTILQDEVFSAIFKESDEVRRARLIIDLEERAAELGVKVHFRILLKSYSKSEKEKEKRRIQEKELRKKQEQERLRQQEAALNAETRTAFAGPYSDMLCVGWLASESGIMRVVEDGKEALACYHPILPIARLKNIESGEEQLKIAFKRNNRWQELNVSKVFTSSSVKIVSLAAHGIAVTSENSKNLVKYLADVENSNTDLIPVVESTSKLGWVKGAFLPYDKNITFDGDIRFKQISEAIHTKGDYNTWLDCMRELRKSGAIEVKAMLAATFASVLIKPLEALPFFLDLWGQTEGGKSVALMVAASVWGNPSDNAYIKDYKGTEVGLEATCDLLNSLPLLLDDSSKKNRRLEDNFEGLVYDLCSGKGKTRSNKGLGLSRETSWKNCIITNGERPLSSYVTQGGAMNRILELQASEKIFENPRLVCEVIRDNYGHAGREFISVVKAMDLSVLKGIQADFLKSLLSNKNMAKQALSLSVLLTADKIAAEEIFKDGEYIDLRQAAEMLAEYEDVSEQERCYRYLIDKVNMNPARFSADNETTERWGQIIDGWARFYPEAFRKLCKEVKYDDKAFLTWALKENLLKTDKDKRFLKTALVFNRACKVIFLKVLDLQNSENESYFFEVSKDEPLPFK